MTNKFNIYFFFHLQNLDGTKPDPSDTAISLITSSYEKSGEEETDSEKDEILRPAEMKTLITQYTFYNNKNLIYPVKIVRSAANKTVIEYLQSDKQQTVAAKNVTNVPFILKVGDRCKIYKQKYVYQIQENVKSKENMSFVCTQLDKSEKITTTIKNMYFTLSHYKSVIDRN